MLDAIDDGDAGVVENHIDLAVLLDNISSKLHHSLSVGDINDMGCDLDRTDVAEVISDAANSFVQALLVDVSDSKVTTLLGQ